MGKVIYMTGAPASGKSSTARMLNDAMPALLVWEYGARLTEHVRSRSPDVATQETVREKSSAIVTPKDLSEVDRKLIEFVASNRSSADIISDSHPVTKERYGFRITPFSLEQFRLLNPDEIWVLYASPAETISRIAKDAAGRPTISEEDARMHTSLQSSVAATYGMATGTAVHLFDTAQDRTTLISMLADRLKGGPTP